MKLWGLVWMGFVNKLTSLFFISYPIINPFYTHIFVVVVHTSIKNFSTRIPQLLILKEGGFVKFPLRAQRFLLPHA